MLYYPSQRSMRRSSDKSTSQSYIYTPSTSIFQTMRSLFDIESNQADESGQTDRHILANKDCRIGVLLVIVLTKHSRIGVIDALLICNILH
jgi:hypothetical protein